LVVDVVRIVGREEKAARIAIPERPKSTNYEPRRTFQNGKLLSAEFGALFFDCGQCDAGEQAQAGSCRRKCRNRVTVIGRG
jgi:hypothetical protein